MKANPGKALKDVLKLAKSTYKKGTAAVGKAVKASVKSTKKTTRSIRKSLRVGGKKSKKSKTMKYRKQKGGNTDSYVVTEETQDIYAKIMADQPITDEEKRRFKSEAYRQKIDPDYADLIIDGLSPKVKAIFGRY
jgi:HD superfamily phosphohydrolase